MKDFRYIDGAAILRLDREACIGCGNCVTVCPHRIFRLEDNKAAVIDPDGCMECGACATNCPVAAIYVNPDDGCGCAALIINRWLSRITGKTVSGCNC
ncbi:4Fe-4S dicluster domain-containing protein [Desulfoprunum benzoelyticum]|uniref:Ferredoxin n=1 Tax=Desulfoprunum benzoelyticum TaxID=1506996 RepID=A0A840USI2_9BACT|nr:mercury methylation ferredoxin HgcB [Desulfoprunum benzoelyticum]MBB5348752.1 ferredoxin [Desulfoprunum benzoelyticum]MBM9529913.1 4Fe-4S dicluster domain-containing protein [Desulfoprunum benzoelyticum]